MKRIGYIGLLDGIKGDPRKTNLKMLALSYNVEKPLLYSNVKKHDRQQDRRN